MSPAKLNPAQIVGIALGVLVILVAVGSIVAIAKGRGAPRGEGFSAGGALRQETDEQVPAGSFTAVEVHGVAGSIDITGSPSASAIAVHSVKTALTRSGMDGVRVEIRAQGDRLVVEEKHDQGLLRSTGKVSFQVTVPFGVTTITARSVSGSVKVSGVPEGVDQALSSVSGSVTTSAARNLDISSTSGHISFASSGSTLHARSVSGSIEGTIESLGSSGSARLGTVSGAVRINAYAGLDATLSLHSVSGGVSCAFPVSITEQKRNSLRGKVGAGAASIDIGTVSGSITIGKLP